MMIRSRLGTAPAALLLAPGLVAPAGRGGDTPEDGAASPVDPGEAASQGAARESYDGDPANRPASGQ